MDQEQRRALFNSVQLIMAEQLPMLTFAAPRMYSAHTARVRGVVPSVMRPPVLWNADTLSVADAPGRNASREWLRFFLRRAAFAVLLVVVASSSALVLTRLAPGDVTAELGPLASARRSARRARAARPRSLHRRPVGALGVARGAGRLRRSYLYNQPVRGLVARAALNTAVLAVSALLVATLVGVGLGVVTGAAAGGSARAGARPFARCRCCSCPCRRSSRRSCS